MSASDAPTTRRRAERHRSTTETEVRVALDLDDASEASIDTGLPFFDHMLAQLARHGRFGLAVTAKGDLEIDAHHTVEDVGIVLGGAFGDALGDKRGIRRFASVALPLDEALVEVALDLSGRAYLHYDVALGADAAPLGEPRFEPQLAEEFWRAFAHASDTT